MSKTLLEMAAEIVNSQCVSSNMTTEQLTASLQNVFKTLQALQSTEGVVGQAEAAAAGEAAEKPMEVTPEKSILKNKIICLECGQEFRMLSPKHLRSHGLTGRQYKEKYGLKRRQPLCARSLSETRRKAGKARGIPDNLRKAIAAKKKESEAKTASND